MDFNIFFELMQVPAAWQKKRVATTCCNPLNDGKSRRSAKRPPTLGHSSSPRRIRPGQCFAPEIGNGTRRMPCERFRKREQTPSARPTNRSRAQSS